ncbi:MAG: hypothetical protein ACOH2R_05730 [Pseudomonas sp.]
MSISPVVHTTDLIGSTAKTLFRSFVTTGAALTTIGSLTTFGVLFTYLHAIGSPELFGEAFSSAIALLPWILIASLILALCLAALMITSASYASVLALFNRAPDDQPYMAGILVLPTLAGVIAMVTSTMLGQRIGVLSVMAISAVAVFFAMLLMFLIPRFAKAVKNASHMELGSSSAALTSQVRAGILLTGALWSTALSATAPMFGVLSITSWPSGQSGAYKLIIVSVVITMLGLVPAMAFYLWKGRPLVRARNAIGGMVVLAAGALFLLPASVPVAVDYAAELIGIKDLRVSPYMLKDTYAAEDFDAGWGKVKTVRGYPVVEGFVLFTLGDIMLLCPKTLARTKLSDWPSVTHACLEVDKKVIKRMPPKDLSEITTAP